MAKKPAPAENTDDADAAALAAIAGSATDPAGPGAQPEPEPDPDPDPNANEDELIDVTVGGQTFKVAKELASAYDTERANTAEEIDSYRGIITATGGGQDHRDANDDDGGDEVGENLWADPAGTLNKFKQDIKNEVRAEVRAETRASDTKTEFWRNFYTVNPELRGFEWVVDAQLRDTWDAIGRLSPDVAASALAKSSKTAILGVTKKFGGKGRTSNDTQNLEGGSSSSGGQPPPDKEDEGKGDPKTLGDAISRRKRLRHTKLRVVNE